jgi:DNA invertase Pin-like site-specific DNA recombinase
MSQRNTPLTGKCESCGEKPRTRVLVKGKLRIACARCSNRVRQGGDFLRPYARLEDRRAQRDEKVRIMHAAGKSRAEIARALGVSTFTVREALSRVGAI